MDEVEEKAKVLDIKGAMAAMIISAFGFVTALFWRDAIQQFIDQIVPKGEGLFYSFAAAVIVTVIAIIVIYLISKYSAVSRGLEERVRSRIKSAHTK